jgi:hypothetical protein
MRFNDYMFDNEPIYMPSRYNNPYAFEPDYYHYHNEKHQEKIEEVLQHYEGIAVAERLMGKKEKTVKINRIGDIDEFWHIDFYAKNGQLNFRGNQYFPAELTTWSVVNVAIQATMSYRNEVTFEHFEYEMKHHIEEMLAKYPIKLRVKNVRIEKYADPYTMGFKFGLGLNLVVAEYLDVEMVKTFNTFFEYLTLNFEQILRRFIG